MLMKPLVSINIAKQFSTIPAGRDSNDGPDSGERFRSEFLVPALNEYDKVIVVLDGTEGYGSSFLDESFGGLIRVEGMTATDLHHRLDVISTDDETLCDEVWDYINSTLPKKP